MSPWKCTFLHDAVAFFSYLGAVNSYRGMTTPVVARQPDVIIGLFVAGVGVYISRVEEGSVAERAGLRPGDTILEVNGTPFSTISHEEALKVS
jgi:S1-C subfamily serine protease